MYLIINFKTYKEATGANAVKLAKQFEQIKTKHKIIICPQSTDLALVAKSTKLAVFSQHLNPVQQAESVKNAGAKGTLLNHSEHKLSFEELKISVMQAKSVGLQVIICAATSEEAKIVSSLNTDFIAIEPPELIGGQISVSSAKPGLITSTLKKVGNIPVLCGAGINTNEDVKKAVALGVSGVLVASSVVLAKDSKKKVEELLAGLNGA